MQANPGARPQTWTDAEWFSGQDTFKDPGKRRNTAIGRVAGRSKARRASRRASKSVRSAGAVDRVDAVAAAAISGRTRRPRLRLRLRLRSNPRSAPM